MTRGGKRPGAGRPKGARNRTPAKAHVTARIPAEAAAALRAACGSSTIGLQCLVSAWWSLSAEQRAAFLARADA